MISDYLMIWIIVEDKTLSNYKKLLIKLLLNKKLLLIVYLGNLFIINKYSYDTNA
jgi:hypothetical protein